MQRKSSQKQPRQKESDKETSDTVNMHIDVLRKTLEMKAHSEKLMNVGDVQVPDEDDRHEEQSRSKTNKANSNIVKDRIWTLASKQQDCDGANVDHLSPARLRLQPLDSDTDAHLHGECDFSAKMSRICISSSTREMSEVECGLPGNFLSM